MEQLLIICEKPSAARNFETALGGRSGTFEGDTYQIVNLFGHVLAHGSPEATAYNNRKAEIGPFSQVDTLPWDWRAFDFNKRIPAPKTESVFREIKSYLQKGYIPVIASDLDAMGEGDLLVMEVLIYVGYHGKIYREYHKDETPKSIVKALQEKKDVTKRNEGYLAGETRMTLDFLTQQIVRAATVRFQSLGYRLKGPVPAGRLKSTILKFVGDQWKAVEAYKPSSIFESVYVLEGLILTEEHPKTYPTKADWKPDGLPEKSRVSLVKKVPGTTKPPKPLSLTGLSQIMSSKGISAKKTAALTQAMYDDCVLTYPRTEDDFVSPEQFEESLSMLDSVIRLIGSRPEVFPYRTPRSTHVKEGGSHGALRPGIKLPNRIEDLDGTYGKGASEIYQTVTERFLSMFLPDTEWVKYVYETTDTPRKFTGSVRIITRKGVSDPDENMDDVATSLPNLKEYAALTPKERKSVKPKTPTESWLLGQLKKENVGTAATQVSTVAALIGNTDAHPIHIEKKTIVLSPLGKTGYQTAETISLGTPDCTRWFEGQIREVRKGSISQESVYDAFTKTLAEDIAKIRTMEVSKELGLMQKKEGVFDGATVRVATEYRGYAFNDSEFDKLFAGESIPISGTDSYGRSFSTTVRLAHLTYEGRPYVGYQDLSYATGTWNGKEVKFKRSSMGYTFTDAEIETLLTGGNVPFTGTSKDGKSYSVVGTLANLITSSGVKYVGVQITFPPREGYVNGTFKGKTATIKGSWGGHTFTKDELDKLFAGQTITITYQKKKGGEGEVSGALAWQTYEGKKFLGFQADFGK